MAPLLPLSALYCLIASLQKVLCQAQKMDIAVVSVGNLVVGGSGKTPLIKALAKEFEHPAIVLRGYKRKSKGLVRVSERGKILCDVRESGDEAMEIAKALPKASVIVSEDRKEGVQEASKEGCDIVFLDDGFRHCMKKFDILIDVKSNNPLCLPLGPKRLPSFFKKKAHLLLQEGKDFRRKVTICNPTRKMVLLTAIANPTRLVPYLPKDVKIYAFGDHHSFEYEEIAAIYQKERPDSFLVTRKDLVKLEKFPFRYSILDLEIELRKDVVEQIKAYQRNFYAKKDTDCPNPS